MHGRNERQIIFVANELSDLAEHFSKIPGGYGEEGAPAIGLRDGFELFIGLCEGVVDSLRLIRRRLGCSGMFFFAGSRNVEFTAERNGKDAHVGGF